jgi:hypothetical protein
LFLRQISVSLLLSLSPSALSVISIRLSVSPYLSLSLSISACQSVCLSLSFFLSLFLFLRRGGRSAFLCAAADRSATLCAAADRSATLCAAADRSPPAAPGSAAMPEGGHTARSSVLVYVLVVATATEANARASTHVAFILRSDVTDVEVSLCSSSRRSSVLSPWFRCHRECPVRLAVHSSGGLRAACTASTKCQGLPPANHEPRLILNRRRNRVHQCSSVNICV